jgi:ribosome-associated translation inhibitor RaiA
VVVEAPHRRHHKGKLYRVCITIAGAEIVVNREHDQATSHEDLYVCINEAFNAARRQLRDHASREHDTVKRPGPESPVVS